MNITELCVWGQVRAPYILYSISIQKITQLTFQILLLFGLTSLSLSFITSDATSQFCSSILLSKVTQFIIHCLEKKKYGYNCCIMCIKLQLSKVPIVFCCNAVVSITTIIKWTKVKYYCCSCNTKRTLLSNVFPVIDTLTCWIKHYATHSCSQNCNEICILPHLFNFNIKCAKFETTTLSSAI